MPQRGSSSSRASKRARSVQEVGESSSQPRGVSTPELREGWSPQPVDFLDILNVYEEWPNLCHKDHPVHLINSMFDATKEAAFHFSGGSLVLHDFYQRVARVNPAMKGVIDGSNFQHLCLLNNRRNDQRVVYALMERWWPSTHTFHLPNVEIGFTPVDFISLTGIPVGLCPPPPFVVDKVDSSKGINNVEELKRVRLERLEGVFPGAERSWADTNCVGIRCRQLGLFLNPDRVPTNPRIDRDLSEDEETLLRAFFLLFIGHELLPNNKSAVSFGWLPAVEDIYRFGYYDWGGVAMARMYRYLDRCATGKTQTVDFCWKVLQVFHSI